MSKTGAKHQKEKLMAKRNTLDVYKYSRYRKDDPDSIFGAHAAAVFAERLSTLIKVLKTKCAREGKLAEIHGPVTEK